MSALDAYNQGSRAALLIGTGIELAFVAAAATWVARTRDDSGEDRFALAALFCVMPSIVPVSWKSYYAALLVPYMLVLAELTSNVEGRGQSAAYALLVISVVLNWTPGSRPNHIALFYSAHFLSSLMLFACVVVTCRDRNSSAASVSAKAANAE
jgi:hypothetical protein